MENEEKIYRYKNVLEQVKIIDIKIQRLNNKILHLKEKTEKIILIDNEIYNLSKFETINTILDESLNVINDNIIPSLIKKISF